MTEKTTGGNAGGKDAVAQTTLSGSGSIARAVIDAGVRVAASYPGGPVTAMVEKLIELAPAGDLYVEWSNCEKVAFEVALGCSLGGRRAVIAAKHVGINHILDPLMTVNLTGSGAGLVILAGDDPGSYGSQNEQDSRILGAFAEIPILEPATPELGYRMTRQAFRLSEAWRLPVMVRFVADYTADAAAAVAREPRAAVTRAEFSRKVRWSALPALVVDDHAALHQKLKQIAEAFDQPPYRDFNSSDDGGARGIIAAGNMVARLRHYAGSIAIAPDGRRLAVTGPKGDAVLLFEGAAVAAAGRLDLPVAAGVATVGAGFVVTRQGGLTWIAADGGATAAPASDLTWDNHLVAV